MKPNKLIIGSIMRHFASMQYFENQHQTEVSVDVYEMIDMPSADDNIVGYVVSDRRGFRLEGAMNLSMRLRYKYGGADYPHPALWGEVLANIDEQRRNYKYVNEQEKIRKQEL